MNSTLFRALGAPALLLLVPAAFGQGADECAAADVIGPGAIVAPFDTNVCSDTGAPATIGAQASSCDSGSDVWFQWTASMDGTATVDTCGANFDTELTAYDGGCAALNELACNDDTCALQSTIEFPITNGTTYYIQVAFWSSTATQAWGQGDLTITEAPPPPPPPTTLNGGMGSNCLTTLFASNNGGAVGGAVYFDLTTTEEITIYSLEANFAAGSAGLPVGMNVYTTPGPALASANDPMAWTLVASDDGNAIGAGFDLPTAIALGTPFNLAAGTYGIALESTGAASHSYTNGGGANQNHTDGIVTLDLGGATNVPFTGGIFMPRVWNGSVCYDTADVAKCVSTVFAANNGGNTGGAVYFDLTAASNISITALEMNYDPTNSPTGTSVGVDVYALNGTSAGNQNDPNAWVLVGTDDGNATASGVLNEPTPVNLEAPINLPAGTYGIALVAVDGSHDYTNGGGANQSHSDGVVSLELGSATNIPFTGGVFMPRVWNGTVCYSAGEIGDSYCSTFANSTGNFGDLAIAGSNSLAANSIALCATGLPTGENGYFLVSTSQGNINMTSNGAGDGVLCVGASGIGRLLSSLQNTGASGSMSASVDITALPQSSQPFIYAAMVGDTLNFQGWYRDANGVNGNNTTDGESILVDV